jgi:hypothetical protein
MFNIVLRVLRDNGKGMEIAREVISWHGKIGNSLLDDAVALARDLPEEISPKQALAFVAKRVAPASVETFIEYTKWQKELAPSTNSMVVEEIVNDD